MCEHTSYSRGWNHKLKPERCRSLVACPNRVRVQTAQRPTPGKKPSGVASLRNPMATDWSLSLAQVRAGAVLRPRSAVKSLRSGTQYIVGRALKAQPPIVDTQLAFVEHRSFLAMRATRTPFGLTKNLRPTLQSGANTRVAHTYVRKVLRTTLVLSVQAPGPNRSLAHYVRSGPLVRVAKPPGRIPTARARARNGSAAGLWAPPLSQPKRLSRPGNKMWAAERVGACV